MGHLYHTLSRGSGTDSEEGAQRARGWGERKGGNRFHEEQTGRLRSQAQGHWGVACTTPAQDADSPHSSTEWEGVLEPHGPEDRWTVDGFSWEGVSFLWGMRLVINGPCSPGKDMQFVSREAVEI